MLVSKRVAEGVNLGGCKNQAGTKKKKKSTEMFNFSCLLMVRENNLLQNNNQN